MSNLNASRRRLLKAMAVLPWCPRSAFAASPAPDLTRIVALEWRPVELLIALGVMPMAVADLPSYRNWVVEPALPPSVQDVGLRTEPNLELLQRIRPSLIVLSNGYGPPPERLAPLAPLLSFPYNDASGLPLTIARRAVVSLGDYLGLAANAKRHLDDIDQQLATTRDRLSHLSSRPLLLFAFIDNRRIIVVGKNSLFQEVMDKVGVANAWQGEVNFWGSTTVGIEQLAQMHGVRAICFYRGAQDPLNEVAQSPLWQSIPFVREGRLQTVPAVWFFGASLAAMRFCRLMEHALESQT